MKKYLLKILLFFITIAVIDVLFGCMCQFLNSHSNGGGTKSRFYVCKESNEDVLIFGSSRAKHHYVPNIIEDSLSLSCYNTGEDGNGIILCYGFLKMITQRYSPRIIVYDISVFDMYEDDNIKYLDLIKPYYYELGIDSIFWSVDPKTRIMMLSSLYRYNTTCLSLVGNYVHPMNTYFKGFSALEKKMDYEPVAIKSGIRTVDTLKMYYFEEFIKLSQSNGIMLVCCSSPTYKAQLDNSYYNPVIDLCQKYNVPFLSYDSDPEIINNKEFFADMMHLNKDGAVFFSNKLVSCLKNVLYTSY